MNLPNEIRFSRLDKGTPAMIVDGTPFPYYIAEKPRVEMDAETGIFTVHIGVLCDRVVVDLTLPESAAS